MKRSRDIAKRMREMLTQDKVGIKEGFSVALTGDLNRLLGDYFELTAPLDLAIAQSEDGEYLVQISAKA